MLKNTHYTAYDGTKFYDFEDYRIYQQYAEHVPKGMLFFDDQFNLLQWNLERANYFYDDCKYIVIPTANFRFACKWLTDVFPKVLGAGAPPDVGHPLNMEHPVIVLQFDKKSEGWEEVTFAK